eukprot:6198944-Pleurochrysis_carterae.AAC.3
MAHLDSQFVLSPEDLSSSQPLVLVTAPFAPTLLAELLCSSGVRRGGEAAHAAHDAWREVLAGARALPPSLSSPSRAGGRHLATLPKRSCVADIAASASSSAEARARASGGRLTGTD